LAADQGCVSLLELLDLSSNMVGVTGTALSWLKSYLTDHYQFVRINDIPSRYTKVRYGIPQEPILGLLLFTFYMLPLGLVMRKHYVNFHYVKLWMLHNFLLLNSYKIRSNGFEESSSHSSAARHWREEKEEPSSARGPDQTAAEIANLH
uniref:Uncharacterized protein n=1 Tax=Astyanax mexicanus TaxID=7994 RepID=A0A3B1KHN7_ASTMX